MLAKSRGFFSFGICFLLFAGACWAQVTAIEGDVKGPDGQPMAKGAKILIERDDMKGTYKGAKTDKKGHYVYNGLPIGTYTVSVLRTARSPFTSTKSGRGSAIRLKWTWTSSRRRQEAARRRRAAAESRSAA